MHAWHCAVCTNGLYSRRSGSFSGSALVYIYPAAFAFMLLDRKVNSAALTAHVACGGWSEWGQEGGVPSKPT